MKHLGDITKISGHNAPPVDVIIGGSPCQDLSVAGKRAGLAGERSGLYMEQIRVIKEMREADVLRGRTDEIIRPRYMVWENVPGAFSSNGGKDFAAVLEEAIRVAEPKAPPVSVPDKGWPTSGCFFDVDGRWSVAWRVFDAQFWGVPQRRRRIALVADFGGLSAPEILFVRKSVSGHSEPGKPKGKEAAGNPGEGADSTVYCLQGNGTDRAETAGCNGKGWREDVCYTLNTIDRPAVMGFAYRAGAKAGSVAAEEEMGPTLLAGRSDAAVFDARGNGDGRIAPTMTGDHQNRVSDYSCILLDDQGGQQINIRNDGTVPTLRAETHGNLPCVMRSFGEYEIRQIASTMKRRDFKDVTDIVVAGLDCRNGRENGDLCGTLQSKPNGGFSYNCIHPVRINHTVRRLTPLECERLQGYPDGWTDIGEWVDSKGKRHKEADSPRYKALGNSIALPNWVWILKRISAVYERDATMASLFDGIGGFPLIWERINGKGSCIWASEIEEFPMAVTKVRLGEER